jgi:hypothetical protein
VAILVLALVEVTLVLLRLLLLAGDAPLLLVARHALALELLLAIALLVLLAVDAIANLVTTRITIADLALLRVTLGGGDARVVRVAFRGVPTLGVLAAKLRLARQGGTGLVGAHLVSAIPCLRLALLDGGIATLCRCALRVLPGGLLGIALPRCIAHGVAACLACLLLLGLALRGFVARALRLLAAIAGLGGALLGGTFLGGVFGRSLRLLLFVALHLVLVVLRHCRRGEARGQRGGDEQRKRGAIGGGDVHGLPRGDRTGDSCLGSHYTTAPLNDI